VSVLALVPTAIGAQQVAATEPVVSGRVEGTVILAAKLSSRKPRVRLDAVYGAPAAPKRPVNELTNVVVYLESVPPPHAARPDPRATMRQVHEAFVPHVLPVIVGTTVAFPNDDPFFHNVFSLSKARSFDLGRYATGVAKSITFDRPGVVQVFCHIHSDMRATILVLENPYFVVADSAGRFALPAVPPGEYRLVAWHERIQPAMQHVRVQPGATVTVQFEIPLPPDATGT
jgi:plastocyanin